MDNFRWVRLAAMADVVVVSAALVELRPAEGHEFGSPSRLLSDALESALTARKSGGKRSSEASKRCFDALVRPCRQLATTGVKAGAVPPLWENVLVAAGWLAAAAEATSAGRDQVADEAGQNCLDACVRLHVFVGRPGSEVARAFREQVALRRGRF